MVDPTPQADIRLWTPTGFCDDEWAHADGADALAGNARVILPLDAFLDMDEAARRASAERLGVLLQPGDKLELIADKLDQLALVALSFPAFSDGRSFSKAELLRSRHGFAGAVRATGQVLVDQLPHMLRVGFDQFEVSNPVLLRRLAEGRIGGIEQLYQPAAVSEEPGQTYSWRRMRD